MKITLPVWKPLYSTLKFFGLPVEWEVSVGAVVYREHKGVREYLILRYPSGHYDFPKGHVEKGETEEETLRREVLEETGIEDVTVLPRRKTITYYYVAKGGELRKRRAQKKGYYIFKEVHFYPAQTETRKVALSHEHTGYVWLTYKKAMRRVTFENARKMLDMAEGR